MYNIFTYWYPSNFWSIIFRIFSFCMDGAYGRWDIFISIKLHNQTEIDSYSLSASRVLSRGHGIHIVSINTISNTSLNKTYKTHVNLTEQNIIAFVLMHYQLFDEFTATLHNTNKAISRLSEGYVRYHKRHQSFIFIIQRGAFIGSEYQQRIL